MADVEYTVQRVAVERTLALRKAVLRPYLPDDEPYALADDHRPTTVAFGAVTPGDDVIGVARIAPEPPPFDARYERSWRLRGMAASPGVRNMGIGSALLDTLIAHVAACGGGILWCNARVAAQGLYERGGMHPWGEVWEDPDIGSHIVMWRDIQ
jgi:ribosomal protein S18 acetylase RimI-like enzyme